MDEFTGGCNCGGVRMTARGMPLRVGVCHCLDCRKHHGAVFYAAAVFQINSVTIIGETRSHLGRHFCTICGASVFAVSNDELELHLGSLDDVNQLVPSYEIWTIRRENWLAPIPNAKQFERGRH